MRAGGRCTWIARVAVLGARDQTRRCVLQPHQLLQQPHRCSRPIQKARPPGQHRQPAGSSAGPTGHTWGRGAGQGRGPPGQALPLAARHHRRRPLPQTAAGPGWRSPAAAAVAPHQPRGGRLAAGEPVCAAGRMQTAACGGYPLLGPPPRASGTAGRPGDAAWPPAAHGAELASGAAPPATAGRGRRGRRLPQSGRPPTPGQPPPAASAGQGRCKLAQTAAVVPQPINLRALPHLRQAEGAPGTPCT